MKNKILTTLASLFIATQANAIPQDKPSCPWPNIVGETGLNQVDRASIGVFVYREDQFNTPENWLFEVGILPTTVTNDQAIQTANNVLPSMGLLFGPILNQSDGHWLCWYYSHTSPLMAVTITDPSHQVPDLKPLWIKKNQN